MELVGVLLSMEVAELPCRYDRALRLGCLDKAGQKIDHGITWPHALWRA
jgi:hypothetical protein